VLVVCGWLAPPAAYVADLNRDHHTLEVELTHLDSALARIDSLNVRMSAFAGVAAAFRRQGADSAWASAALAGIALGLPANVHLHAVSLERGGPIRLQVHSNEGPQAKDSVLSRWPGSLIEEGPTSGEFAVELEGGP
jgi:Tfp pilus assembly protein PilN